MKETTDNPKLNESIVDTISAARKTVTYSYLLEE